MLIKRIFDIVISSIVIILTLPLMVLITFLIKLDSFGPAIFKQMRVGVNRRKSHAGAHSLKKIGLVSERRKNDLGGKPFTMYKFRSMVQEAEALLPCLVNLGSLKEPVYKFQDDPRVTRFGKFLRKSSLDELPQLFNVFIGDMSLVGPRPEASKIVELYGEEHKRRLETVPGITGLQQIKCRGTKSMKERLKYDLTYIKHRSLLLDFWILFMTVFSVILGKGAY